MPLDHFVSQVHLRNFYSEDGHGRLIGVKKDDLKKFRARSENVCRREDGSTNDYLREPRVIEQFLRGVEPNYNAAVVALRNRAIDVEDVYVIAGFVAYVMSCSPTAMRLGKPHLAAAVQTAAEILDADGKLPRTPDILGGRSMTDLLNDGSVSRILNTITADECSSYFTNAGYEPNRNHPALAGRAWGRARMHLRPGCN